MQRLEVSGAVRDIYIYIYIYDVSRLWVKALRTDECVTGHENIRPCYRKAKVSCKYVNRQSVSYMMCVQQGYLQEMRHAASYSPCIRLIHYL
jgi:hypothetical protein